MKIFGGYYKYLILSVFFEIIFYDQRIVPRLHLPETRSIFGGKPLCPDIPATFGIGIKASMQVSFIRVILGNSPPPATALSNS